MSQRCIKFNAMRINEAFGAFLREYRKSHSLTMEQIANATHAYGSGWDTSAIGSFERGKRATTLSNILIMLQSLSDITGEQLYLESIMNSDAMSDDGDVQLSNSLIVSRDRLIAALSGNPVDIKPLPEVGTKEWRNYVCSTLTAMEDSSAVQEKAKEPTVDWLVTTRGRTPTISECRAAKKLDMLPEYVVAWCYGLFQGRSLDEEAIARAGDDANAQKRGRATRRILEDIRNAIDVKAEVLAEQIANGDL